METAALEIFFATQWEFAIEKHKRSLDQDDRQTVESFRSWNDVRTHVLKYAPRPISLIHPALEHLNVFANIFATKLVASLDLAFFWGALACLLQLIAETEEPETLAKVPRMIKQLVHQAEAFNGLCSSDAEMDNSIKEACFDMQVLYLDFLIASIKYIHGAGEARHFIDSALQGGGSPLQLIERFYASTLQDLKEALNRVEKLAHTRSHFRVQSPQSSGKIPLPAKPRCLMLPGSRTTRTFDRADVFMKLDQILASTAGRTFRSVALHGMGGVGKSTVASTYAKAKFEENAYDTVLWAHAEKPISLRQSFTDIALRLKLLGAQPQKHEENLVLVQDWFESTDSNWLIVYDNVESASIITAYWPGSSKGRAIITTRNHSLAFEPAAVGLEVTSWDTQTGSEFLLFMLKKSVGRDLEAESASALALSERLSGHALALAHMAGLIYEGEVSIQEFMVMYLRNPRRAHSTDALSALWDFSFKSLDTHSLSLVGVLSFLMPDHIPQELFEGSSERLFPADLEFCNDEFSFSIVLRKLLNLALVKREKETRTIMIHRLVQTQLKQFLTQEDRQRSFNNAVMLLCGVFPSEEVARGQLYDRWGLCNRYLQHVLSLKDCFFEETKASKGFTAPWEFCSLLSTCQRFLSEINEMSELRLVCDINLVALGKLQDGPKKMDLKATILSHQAQAAESLGEPAKAIELNKQAYEIRLQEKPCLKMMLCYTANNLGYCHNTANLHEESEKWFEKSREWWESMIKDGEESRDRPARHIKNHARCLTYRGKYAKAKEMFDISIPRLRIEKPLNWAMLGYALFALATMNRRQREFEAAEAHYMEAQNAWVKGDQARVHPFYAGCLYKIGACCLDQGKVEAAIKHFRDSMEITMVRKIDRPVEHARVLFKLSEALLQDDLDESQAEAVVLREEAEVTLKKARSNAARYDTEDAYDDLVPIFWR